MADAWHLVRVSRNALITAHQAQQSARIPIFHDGYHANSKCTVYFLGFSKWNEMHEFWMLWCHLSAFRQSQTHRLQSQLQFKDLLYHSNCRQLLPICCAHSGSHAAARLLAATSTDLFKDLQHHICKQACQCLHAGCLWHVFGKLPFLAIQ